MSRLRHIAFCAALTVMGLTGTSVAQDCIVLMSVESFSATGNAPAGAVCQIYQTMDGTTGTSCHWAFAYRGDDHQPFADALWQKVTSCTAGQPVPNDPQVNHPDSYGLKTWNTSDSSYSVAIKDKAALNKTFVFLRADPITAPD